MNVPSKEPEPFEPEPKESKEVDLPVGEPNLDQPTPDLVPNRLKEKELRELLKHRLQGHASYHPACEHCRMSRSVKQRKRSQGSKGVEVQADFAVVEALSNQNCFKVLCLTERESGAVGYVAVGSNYDKVVAETGKWAASIGVTGPSSATVLVRSDMEPSLVNLLRRAIPCIVETVGPQEHEQVGSAERSVRLLKERLSCLRADAQGAGFDIVLKEETLPVIVRYIATTHNYHRLVRGAVEVI